MGAGISYKEGGNSYDNTVTTNDIISLRSINAKPRKISHIRVFVAEYIVGFECYYDGVSAGARLGFEFDESEAVPHDFQLQSEEFFTRVTGTSAEVVDSLTFYTNTGRSFSVGTNRRGTHFELSKPNKVICYFNVGFGRYMHKFGAYFSKKPRRLNVRDLNRYYTTNINSSVLSMSSTHSSRSVQRGIVTDSHINVMPSVTISQVPRAQPLSNVGLQYPGVSHNRSVSHQPNMLVRSQTAPAPRREVRAQRTLFGGLKYNNTIHFDDYDKLMKGHSTATMIELRIVHDEFCIYGLQPIYMVDGEKVAETHCKTPLPAGVKNEIIPINVGECITSIAGTHSDIINSLVITLSTGKVYKFGKTYLGSTLDKNFKLQVPAGQKCLAIAGGYNSYLHFIGCYYI